jgi:hypothetical protein
MTQIDTEAFTEDAQFALSRFRQTLTHLENVLEAVSHVLPTNRKAGLNMLDDTINYARQIHAQMAAIRSAETLVQQRKDAGL